MTSAAALGGDAAAAWMDAVGVTDLAYLERRLVWAGLPPDPAAAARLLGAPTELPSLFEVLDWVDPPAGATDVAPGTPAGRESFPELWRHVAGAAMDRLVTGLDPDVAAQVRSLDVSSEEGGRLTRTRDSLVAGLARELSEVGEPVVWELFNRRRTPADIVHAALAVEGPSRVATTVYRGFVDGLVGTRLSEVFSTYPVLPGLVALVVDQWTRSTRTLLKRVHDDRPALLEAFGIPRDALLGIVESRLSDPHRGGQSVAALEFVSGEPGRGPWLVMYKPKDLEIDRVLEGILRALPPLAAGDDALRSATVLTRPGYGYMEHLAHRTCSDEGEMRRFYRNAGRLTALLHVLGATDCHHENLVADGDQLCLVDAETLLTGRSAAGADDLGARVADSVASIGVLPQWYLFGKARIPRDVSALGVDPPRDPTTRVRGWIDLNTDAMLPGDVQRAARPPTSLPVGVGGHNPLSRFVDDFCGGLRDQLGAVAEQKEAWLGADGYLSRFEGCRRRVVVRPTWLYAWLRRRQLEPSALRSPQARRLVLEVLARTYLVADEKPRNWPLLDAELRQVELLDVPFFDMPVEATDLTLPDGSVIEGFVAVPGLATARAKVEALDEASIAFQLDLARGTVLAKNHLLPLARPSTSPGDGDAGRPVRRDRLTLAERTTEAELIAARLGQAAVQCNDGLVEWLGLDVLDDLERLRYGPVGPSAYGGRTGVALFLATLSLRCDPSDAAAHRGLALSACADLTRGLLEATSARRERWWAERPLGLAGSGGIVLGLLQLGELLPELDLRDGVRDLVDQCRGSLVESDQRLDVVFGVAGLIGPLLAVGSPAARHLAETAGTTLLRHQETDGGWATLEGSDRPLTGFSHGAGGIAAALGALYSTTGTAAYRDAAQRAQAYERDVFDPVARNWPDFRTGRRRGARSMLSWCHGAPGIALSRMCLESSGAGDTGTQEEIVTALTATAGAGGSTSDTLCCGRLGRAAILRLGADHCGDPAWRRRARVLELEALAAKARSSGFDVTASYGLFTGEPGIGLALLAGGAGDGRISRVLRTTMSSGTYDPAATPGP